MNYGITKITFTKNVQTLKDRIIWTSGRPSRLRHRLDGGTDCLRHLL